MKRITRAESASLRRGQALVEFAIISFVLTAMLAGFLGLIVMGLGSFQNNIAAESAGRVLDEHERLLTTIVDSADGPAERTRAVYDALLNEGLYDETQLILSRAEYYDSDAHASLPEINRMLLGSFIYDPDLDLFRYPGAVVKNMNGMQTVLIPLLKNTDPPIAKGIDRAFNVSLGDTPVSDDWVGPVAVSHIDQNRYRIVIFYPSQPGSMLNLEVERDADGQILSQTPIEADDSAISLSDLPTGYTFDTPTINSNVDASTSRGQYGLGQTFAFLKAVRPYRRVFESASVFRLTEPDVPDEPATEP